MLVLPVERKGEKGDRGDGERGGLGERIILIVSLSPCPLVPMSPCPLVPLSPCLLVPLIYSALVELLVFRVVAVAFANIDSIRKPYPRVSSVLMGLCYLVRLC